MSLTDKDEAIMAVLQGVPVEVVADELNVSAETVYRWMREGGHTTQARKIQEREIADVYVNEPDKTVFDIADQFEISVANLYHILHRQNTPLRRPTRAKNPEVDELVVSMYRKGAPLKDIRRATGKGYGTIYEILEDYEVRLRQYSTRRGE